MSIAKIFKKKMDGKGGVAGSTSTPTPWLVTDSTDRFQKENRIPPMSTPNMPKVSDLKILPDKMAFKKPLPPFRDTSTPLPKVDDIVPQRKSKITNLPQKIKMPKPPKVINTPFSTMTPNTPKVSGMNVLPRKMPNPPKPISTPF